LTAKGAKDAKNAKEEKEDKRDKSQKNEFWKEAHSLNSLFLAPFASIASLAVKKEPAPPPIKPKS
jgi:hypothetical protein